MSILDLLLETDIKKLELNNSKEYEIKRLSEILGKRFTVTCCPINTEQVAHIGEISKNNTEVKHNTIIESCRIDGKKLNNKELMEKFKAVTPTELVGKMFLSGEIYELYTIINNISGYGRDAVEEIKN